MDSFYNQVTYTLSEMEHRYGPKVHILGHPALLSLLSRACSPKVVHPEFTRLIRSLYFELAHIIANAEFPVVRTRVPTRMIAYHREGVYEGKLIDPSTKVVCVDVARAGMVPTQACFEAFCELLKPVHVRQDHVFANRRTDRKGRVVGTDLSGSKIGGPIDRAILIVSDPMAATGSSASAVLDHYSSLGLGKPRKVLALHLIATPEYLHCLRRRHPEATIYAIRLDRGLSPKKVLASVPGTYWSEERGLNDRHYIVPGGGGFGELMNNALE